MASLSSAISGSQMVEFFNRAGRLGGLTPEMVARLNGDDALMKWWMESLRESPFINLIHGRFNSLEKKLDMVRNWPGVTEGMIRVALAEAVGRIAMFERESPENQFLNIVVSRYLGTAPETFAYARDRMHDFFGEDYCIKWSRAHAKGITENRVRYMRGEDSPHTYSDCVRIEVVDLAANWNGRIGIRPRDNRGANLAHATVLFATVQDPEWVRQMDGKKVPYALAGGFEMNAPDSHEWRYVPCVSCVNTKAHLDADLDDSHYYTYSLPILLE